MARVDASASLIPAVSCGHHTGLILQELRGAGGAAGVDRRGDGYALVNARPAVTRRPCGRADRWGSRILNGAKCWITNGGKSTGYGDGGGRSDRGANGISASYLHKDDGGSGRKNAASSGSRGRRPPKYFENCRISDRIIR